MVARVNTVASHGIDVRDIDVQVQMAAGLPAFTIVGRPDKALAEWRERVHSALEAMGLGLPPKRITANMAPADNVKVGSYFHLPIALGLLVGMEVLQADEIAGYSALGASARVHGLISAAACGGEGAWAGPINVLAAPSLLALVNHFEGTQKIIETRSRGLALFQFCGRLPANR
jgi:magnesium chelatase family protein